MFDVIYLCAGTGKRANLGYPKQFGSIHGNLIFMMGIETLCKIKEINKIIMVCPDKEEERNYIQNSLRVYNIPTQKEIDICIGGQTRQESVYKGLSNVTTKYLLIMEAVRPFTSIELIKKVIDIDNKVVIPVSSLKSTLCGINDIGTICVLDKSNFGEVQMPQKYELKKLITYHSLAYHNNISNCSDDLDLIIKINNIVVNDEIDKDIKLIEGEEENIKITTPLDLKIAEEIYSYKYGEKNE